MELKSILTASETKYFDEATYIHNNVSLDDFYKNRNIEIGVRLMIYFLFLFSMDKNKNKEANKRIFVHNRHLLKKLGYDVHNLTTTDKEYLNFLSALQSTLKRYEDAGFFMREIELPDGSRIKASEAPGYTDRYIVLNVNKCKELLSSLPEHVQNLGYNKASRESRFINKRPVTLKSLLINKIIKMQVSDVHAHKKVNKYLERQYKRYTDFSGAEINQNLFNASGEFKDVLDTLLSAIYDAPQRVLKVTNQ